MGGSDATKKIGLKRKGTAKTSLPRKKAKIQHRSADYLPWKAVSRPFEAGTGFDDGILDFEEVEGVEVVYESTDGGRVVKFNVSFISERLYPINSLVYQVITDETEAQSTENHNGVSQQETEQEPEIEPIVTFDCTPPYDVSSIPVLIVGSQLKSYYLNGRNILFIQRL